MTERGPKRAVVTGGSAGIGRALVERLAARGARVWTVSRHPVPDAPRGVWALVGDLTDPRTVRALADAVERDGGGLDLLVNNAGVLGPRVTLDRYPPEEWDRVLAVNATTPFRVIQSLLPALARSRRAVVLNVSSGAGVRGRACWGAYAASKFAVEGLTQVLADELGDGGIRVHAVDPGGTATAMRAAAYPDEDPGTLPTPDAVALAILRMVDADPPPATGTRLRARDWMDAAPLCD